NIDYVDLINVHDIEFADLEQVCKETLPGFRIIKPYTYGRSNYQFIIIRSYSPNVPASTRSKAAVRVCMWYCFISFLLVVIQAYILNCSGRVMEDISRLRQMY
ncbi:hypothetical protein D0T87_24380, partial [Bacteroides sp. 51]|nr:hypothetical protein [Bacteroides sp. 51]